MTQTVHSIVKKSPPKPKSNFSWLKTILVHFLLLGIGGVLAFAGGIILGIFLPQDNPKKPLSAKIWDNLHEQEKVTSKPNPQPTPSVANIGGQLTIQQRLELQNEIEVLQAQLNTLNNRTAELESQLGRPIADQSLETRLQTLEVALQDPADAPEVSLSPSENLESKSTSNKLKVTLPSDLLFTGTNSTLSAEASSILETIIKDLRQYEGTTIRISAHTNATKKPEDNRELSFRRAQAVEQYLAKALGKKNRLVVIGYGQTHPLVRENTENSSQLNRRSEITVD